MKTRTALTVIGAVFAVHVLGIIYNWYYQWRDMDVLMHGLGGFSMGLLAVSFLKTEAASKLPYWQKLLFVLGFAAIVGIFWEFAEFGIDQYHLIQSPAWEALTLRDTLGDLMNDLVGGLIAYIFFIKK